MFGCWGWSKVDPSFMADRVVYVVFDADLKSNRDVWNAAAELRGTAKAVKSAGVRFVAVPGSGSTGLDDFLANIGDPAKRREAMAALIEGASPDLPKAPAKKRSTGPASAFFDERGGTSSGGGVIPGRLGVYRRKSLPFCGNSEPQKTEVASTAFISKLQLSIRSTGVGPSASDRIHAPPPSRAFRI
jgi:hypothetical protein